MDLVAEEDREAILEDRKRFIAESCSSCGVTNFQCFGTSIWDESLYKAWSEIVTNLIPNISLLETHLNNFCRICDADEVVLFERATFLVISHAQASDDWHDDEEGYYNYDDEEGGDVDDDPAGTSAEGAAAESKGASPEGGVDGAADGGGQLMRRTGSGTGGSSRRRRRHVKRTPHFDAHRFEKISNIVKQFKLSCGKAQSQFQGMQVRNSRFSAFIDAFTANTYIMVIVSNPSVHTAATLLNIQNARNHFEKFIPRI